MDKAYKQKVLRLKLAAIKACELLADTDRTGDTQILSMCAGDVIAELSLAIDDIDKETEHG